MAKLSEAGTLGVVEAAVTCYNSNCATVGVEVSGTYVGTITFEARTGKTWANAQVFSVAGVSVAATTTTTVTRMLAASGCNAVRARMSAFTSGEALIQFSGTEAASSGGGGGGGGGAVTIADGADVAEGSTTDAAVVTDSNGTVTGFLRGIVKTLIATLTTQGTKTTNGAVPGTNNIGVLPSVATAAAPSNTEGRQVASSADLSGFQRGIVHGTVAGAGAAAGINPILTGFVGTGATIRNWTASNSVTATAGNDVPGIGPLVYSVSGVTWDRMRDTTSAENSSGAGLAGAGLVAWDGSVYRRLTCNASGQITLASSKAEDAGHTTGDTGIFTLAVRQDTQSALAGTTLDYIPFTTDANGSLRSVSGGYTTVVTSSLTRPADTNAYAAGDEMSTSTSAPAVNTITGAARFSGGSGIIQGILVSQSTLWTTKPAMEIWIFDTTTTPNNDNAAFAPADADTDTCIAVIPITASYAGTVNQTLDSGLISVPFVTVGSANLYFRVVMPNAAQDSANSGVSKFRFRVLQD